MTAAYLTLDTRDTGNELKIFSQANAQFWQHRNMRGIDIPDEVKRRLLRSANDRDSDSRGIGEWAVQQSRNLDVPIKLIKNSRSHQTRRQMENMNDSVECCGESWSGSGDHGDTPDQRLRSHDQWASVTLQAGPAHLQQQPRPIDQKISGSRS